jgi:two-component system CheB/CheR fusion protein
MATSTPADAIAQGFDCDAWLAAVIESSDDAIISKTLAGVITSWNAGAARIFGYTADEALGQPITMLIAPERWEEEAVILARLTRGERVDHYETVRQTKDGRGIEVSVTVSPVRDGAGRVVGASKIARDISVQKRAERDLLAAREVAEAARAEAETANRAKDLFLSVLSHELRTPLAPVLGAVGLIEGDLDMPAQELRQLIKLIRRNVEAEARLVDDLLDATRISRGKVELHPEAVDAHAAIRSVVAMLQGEIDAKGLEVTMALRANACDVWADPGRFQQVLLNLLSNAVKFTPERGSIAVRTERDGGDGECHGLAIEVADTGIGIDPATLPRLFRPFEQGERAVTRRFGGLGLGLSIVRSLVELHGGTVTATSAGIGTGATFTLRLRTAAAPQPADAGPPPAVGARPAGTARVLLVEDHDDTRRVMTRLLHGFGCQVTAAATVRAAIALADGQPFDLLVSDIGLPDGTGLDVMRHLRDHNRVRGIAISGFGQDDDRQRSLDAGFECHLTKPISFQALRDVVLRMTA